MSTIDEILFELKKLNDKVEYLTREVERVSTLQMHHTYPIPYPTYWPSCPPPVWCSTTDSTKDKA